MSKSTPKGAVAKFATGGKPELKRPGANCDELWKYLCSHSCYGAKDEQTLRALMEAEKYDGPSIMLRIVIVLRMELI